MGDLFWAALALMLVFEGVLPFANPRLWREVFLRAAQMEDTQIRWVGLVSMALGATLLLFLSP